VIILDCDQNTDEWLEHRRGMFNASEAKNIITPTGKPSASAKKYIARIIAEMVYPNQDFQGNQWTERGHELEPEARQFYEMETGNTVVQVGRILLDDRSAGVSPDGLIASDGMLEIKCPKPETHVLWLNDGVLPNDHKAQCHAALHIAQRQWLDFFSYCPGFDPLLVRVEPDEFTKQLAEVLEEFTQRLNAAKGRIFEDAA
jgi:putative phage-type endonuclease